MTHASNQKCVKCGRPAVAFWPACDPDIKSFPYCRACLDNIKIELLIELSKLENELAQFVETFYYEK